MVTFYPVVGAVISDKSLGSEGTLTCDRKGEIGQVAGRESIAVFGHAEC